MTLFEFMHLEEAERITRLHEEGRDFRRAVLWNIAMWGKDANTLDRAHGEFMNRLQARPMSIDASMDSSASATFEDSESMIDRLVSARWRPVPPREMS